MLVEDSLEFELLSVFEISYFQISSFNQGQKLFRLEIAVDDLAPVQVLEDIYLIIF